MNDPLEEFLVQAFCQRVNQFLDLTRPEVLCHNLRSNFDMVGSKRRGELFMIDGEKFRDLIKQFGGNDLAKLIIFMFIQVRLQVTQMQYGR